MPILTVECSPPNSTTAKAGIAYPLPCLVDPVVIEPATNTYPVVRVDVDAISEATASRLAASLLGHVLFLKNQIPFPVMQLGRIPGGKGNSRAAKLRTELMASFDTISSHLDTTFSALSTALALCRLSGRTQAHVAILVGPSLGSAKSKVIMGIDGLEKKLWAIRNNGPASENTYGNDEEESEDEDDLNSVESEGKTEEQPDDSEDEEADSDEEEDAESEDDGTPQQDETAPDDLDNVESEDETEEQPDDSEDEEEGSEDEADSDEEEDAESEDNGTRRQDDTAPPPPYVSYAEEQKFLQTADRLLSRVLAAADAEGNGISSEMSPTQTHILIRAPRIFKHPAWVPRQNVTASLDATLYDFLTDSGVPCPDLEVPKRGSKKSKVEGVWVTTRGGIYKPIEPLIPKPAPAAREVPVAGDEDADMIWWSWDGKFVGFSDW